MNYLNDFDRYDMILNEGKFDSIIGQITSDIFNFIKQSKESKEKISKIKKEYFTPFDFVVKIIIDREYSKYVTDVENYQIFNAWSDVRNGKSYMEITIDINPNDEPQIYSKLIGEIKGTLRHELEHLTQYGPNRIKDRPVNDDDELKIFYEYIKKNKLDKIITDKTEIPAYVYGLYKRSKTEKKPLDEVFEERLDYFIRMKRLKKEDKEKIFKKWMNFAKKHLPNAKYSKTKKPLI